MKFATKKRYILPLFIVTISFLLPPSQLSAAPFGPLHPGGMIEQLPNGYRTLRGKLFFHDGFYFRPAKHGYRVVRPPIGLIIASLPVGCVSLSIGGVGYFYYQDVYYRPVDTGYLVVEKPVETALKQPIEQASVGDKVAIFAEWQNLRSGPGKKHSVQQTPRKGTELAVKAVIENWYFVELTDGSTGWVMIRYTRKLMNPAQG